LQKKKENGICGIYLLNDIIYISLFTYLLHLSAISTDIFIVFNVLYHRHILIILFYKCTLFLFFYLLNLQLQNCTSKLHLWNGTSETDNGYITSATRKCL